MSSPLRILLVSEDYEDPRVGAVIATRRLQQTLRNLSHICDVWFTGDECPRPLHERGRMLVSPWLAWRGVRRRWRNHGPYDVIDAAGAEGCWIGLARRWGAFPGAALVARTHGLEHLYYAELLHDHRAGVYYKPWWRRAWYPLTRMRQVSASFCFADKAIVLGVQGRRYVAAKRWKRPEDIALIAHGIEPERWGAAPALDSARGRGALFSATWYSSKGITYLAWAHDLLLQRGLQLPLTLLSAQEPLADSERHIRSIFSAASQPLLTVLPRTADVDQVYEHYRQHDLLVVPSTFDGFGMVVTEAMSQRLPVVCSTGAGVSDHLEDGVNALIVPSRNSVALANGMEKLWRDPDLRRRIGESGYHWVKDQTWERAAKATLAVYEDALARRASSAT